MLSQDCVVQYDSKGNQLLTYPYNEPAQTKKNLCTMVRALRTNQSAKPETDCARHCIATTCKEGGRLALTMILCEGRAGLVSMEQRLHNQTIAFWVSLHKLGQSHPYWMLKRQRLCTKHRSLLMWTAEMCREVRMDDVMEVKPCACPP
jgi:hypothetical protein